MRLQAWNSTESGAFDQVMNSKRSRGCHPLVTSNENVSSPEHLDPRYDEAHLQMPLRRIKARPYALIDGTRLHNLPRDT